MHRHGIFLTCFVLLFTDAWSASPNPKETTLELFRNVSQILKSDDNTQKRKEGLKLLKNYFDFDTFAQWTLNDYWETLSQTQRKKFLSLFRDRFYEKTLNRLSGQTKRNFLLNILAEKPTKEFTEIKCELQYDSKKAKFSLTWISAPKGWRLVDIEVSNTSLVANYQGQFNKIIRDHGFDGVLSRLKGN